MTKKKIIKKGTIEIILPENIQEEKAAEPMTIEMLDAKLDQVLQSNKRVVDALAETEKAKKKPEDEEEEKEKDKDKEKEEKDKTKKTEEAGEEKTEESEKEKPVEEKVVEGSTEKVEETEKSVEDQIFELLGKVDKEKVPEAFGKWKDAYEKKKAEALKNEEVAPDFNNMIEDAINEAINKRLDGAKVTKRSTVPQPVKKYATPLDFTYEELAKGDVEALLKKAGYKFV